MLVKKDTRPQGVAQADPSVMEQRPGAARLPEDLAGSWRDATDTALRPHHETAP